MECAEKICRKIRCCRIPFSPDVAIWTRQVQMYLSLLRYHKGKTNTPRNLKQAAWRCNIPDPLLLLIQEIINRLEGCKKECVFYQEHGRQFRRKHLENQKKIAQEQKDEEAFNKISADFWCKLNYVTGKKRTRSATTIQVEERGRAIMEQNTQDTVEQSIFSEVHEKQYTLAGEAPICNGTLFQDFGYTASTPASRAVLDGTYVVSTDPDNATKELFAEIAAIQKLIPKNRAMETVLEGSKQRDVVIGIGATLWALHSGEQVEYYLPLPCSMSDSDTGSCGATRTVVTQTVGDAEEDPWSNPGD